MKKVCQLGEIALRPSNKHNVVCCSSNKDEILKKNRVRTQPKKKGENFMTRIKFWTEPITRKMKSWKLYHEWREPQRKRKRRMFKKDSFFFWFFWYYQFFAKFNGSILVASLLALATPTEDTNPPKPWLLHFTLHFRYSQILYLFSFFFPFFFFFHFC